MKVMKKIFVAILMFCMVMSFCACGNSNSDANNENKDNVGSENNNNNDNEGNENDDSQNENEDDDSQNEDDGNIVYQVMVVDEDGNPISGVMVQVCDEGNCYAPSFTNDEGIAEFRLAESSEYKTKIVTNPTGYEAVETDYVHFEDGSTTVTLTVKAVE